MRKFNNLVGCQIFTTRIPSKQSESFSGIYGWKAGLACVPSQLSFHFVKSISLTQTQAKNIIKTIPDNANGQRHWIMIADVV